MRKALEGILGMSGNPTHQGHIATARAACTELGLGRVRLMINPFNPHKNAALYAPFEDRLQIAQYEVAADAVSNQSIVVCDFENSLRARGVPNQTVAMLAEFEQTFSDVQPVWMMGADVMQKMHTWGGSWRLIFERYPVVVFARPGDHYALDSVAGRAYSHLAVRSECFVGRPGQWTCMETADHPASSTAIRAEIRVGRKPAHLTDASYEYIVRNRLYGAPQ